MRSVFESERELNRSGLVALGVDRSERGRTPVRVRVAEQRSVEQIADVDLDTGLHRFAELELLKDVHVLAVVGEPAHGTIDSRRIPELERSRIRPGVPV